MIPRSRDYRSHQDFLRHARQYMQRPLYESVCRDYRGATAGSAAPADAAAALRILDELPGFALHGFLFRNLQRLKYSHGAHGILGALQPVRTQLEAQLAAACADAGDRLRLNPALPLPEYYRIADFHQHAGGVSQDPLAGLIYEEARHTTVAAHADPNQIYRLLFDAVTQPGRRYDCVLDWGTGHGAGILTWARRDPHSECHAVDLSAPCLQLAYLRSREAGVDVRFSQQDFERLGFPGDFFDLIFHVFMLHEIPAARMRACLEEAYRVLRPGGIFAGKELALIAGEPYQNAIQIVEGRINNEPYMEACFSYPFASVAREIGFRRIDIRPFQGLMDSVLQPSPGMPRKALWNLYVFEK